jgi:hypothetical protein
MFRMRSVGVKVPLLCDERKLRSKKAIKKRRERGLRMGGREG